MNKHGLPETGLARLPLVAAVALSTAALATPTSALAEACSTRVLRAGFYAHFSPVSYSADREPGSAGFDLHRGYEADLLTALEAMEGAGISFERRPIAEWDGIWLRSAGAEFDLVGGGITILDSRTRDASGATRVTFTPGHVEFRQSLLVRSADARRLAEYRDLTADLRVGVLAATTGEARLLQIVGLSDQEGVLAKRHARRKAIRHRDGRRQRPLHDPSVRGQPRGRRPQADRSTGQRHAAGDRLRR